MNAVRAAAGHRLRSLEASKTACSASVTRLSAKSGPRSARQAGLSRWSRAVYDISKACGTGDGKRPTVIDKQMPVKVPAALPFKENREMAEKVRSRNPLLRTFQLALPHPKPGARYDLAPI